MGRGGFVRLVANDGDGSVQVLWLSRHAPLQAEVDELRRIYGKIRVIQVGMDVDGAGTVLRLAGSIGARVVVPVLPPSTLAELLSATGSGGIEVLLPVMRKVLRTESYEEAVKAVAKRPDRRTLLNSSNGLRVMEFKGFVAVRAVDLAQTAHATA